MKYSWLLALLLLSCGVTQQASCPPTLPPIVKLDTIYMPIKVPVYDTAVRDSAVLTAIPLYIDTAHRMVNIGAVPNGGDNWPQLQAATDWVNLNQSYTMFLTDAVRYPTSQTIVSAVFNSDRSDYGQSVFRLKGPVNAANDVSCAQLVPEFDDGPVIAVQQCKGFEITNIGSPGSYDLPNTLTALQIDTMSQADWYKTPCTHGRTNPHCFLAIDPFDPPGYHTDSVKYPFYPRLRQYYLPNMSLAGSTAGWITHCEIDDYVVGVLETGGMCANGEFIHLEDNVIDYCESAIAYSQAQSKANTVTRLMCWGNTRTVLNGTDYGFSRTDGATPPMCDTWNVAGNVYQLFSMYLFAYPFTAQRIYAEEIHQVGLVYGNLPAHFMDWQVDFQTASSFLPSPWNYIYSRNVTWDNCTLRQFNGNVIPKRLQLSNPGDEFHGCCFGNAPITRIAGHVENAGILRHNTLYFKTANYLDGAALSDSGANDTWAQLSVTDTLHVDRSTFTGWLLEGKTLQLYDNLSTYDNHPMGIVYRIAGDTAFIQNLGDSSRDRRVYNLWYNRLKN